MVDHELERPFCGRRVGAVWAPQSGTAARRLRGGALVDRSPGAQGGAVADRSERLGRRDGARSLGSLMPHTAKAAEEGAQGFASVHFRRSGWMRNDGGQHRTALNTGTWLPEV